jgi:hypothetical protein
MEKDISLPYVGDFHAIAFIAPLFHNHNQQNLHFIAISIISLPSLYDAMNPTIFNQGHKQIFCCSVVGVRNQDQCHQIMELLLQLGQLQ